MEETYRLLCTFFFFFDWGRATLAQAGAGMERGRAIKRSPSCRENEGNVAAVSGFVTLGALEWQSGWKISLDSKDKLKGEYNVSYLLHNLPISNTSILSNVCVYIYLCQKDRVQRINSGSDVDSIWPCKESIPFSLFFHKRENECLYEPFLLPPHRLCRTSKKRANLLIALGLSFWQEAVSFFCS